jgi:RimJ/RimL family protein N-acetyltransferase
MIKMSHFSTGERIYLRPHEEEDINLFEKWFNDPEYRVLEGYPLPQNKVELKRFFEEMCKDEKGVYLGISLQENDRLIGSVSLFGIDRISRSVEFGIGIGEKDCWGKGYGTEAINLILDYCFDTLNMHRVWLRVRDYNQRAIRCYERAGFRREGILRESLYISGAYHDQVCMSLLKEEWLRRE